MANLGETVTDFIWGWAPKSLQMVIAAMKLRHLLLGRKTMTNLDSILKSREITLPKKVHLVKAMFFPVFMYGCESWTIQTSLFEKTLMMGRIESRRRRG